MGKVFKSIVSLGALGGALYGGLKLKKQMDYVKSVYSDTVLFGEERIVYDDVFEGDSIASMFAGVEIDLTEMIIEEDEATLDLYGFCAGIDVIVPEGINVIHNGESKASGINVNVAEYENDDIFTLYINYDLTCCGLNIETSYDEDDDYEDEEDEAVVEETKED